MYIFLKEKLVFFFFFDSINSKTYSINLACNLFTSINTEEIVNETVR